MTTTVEPIKSISELKKIQKQFDNFFTFYVDMGKILNDLPIHPSILDRIRYEMDTGFLWVKEALNAAIATYDTSKKEKHKKVKAS